MCTVRYFLATPGHGVAVAHNTSCTQPFGFSYFLAAPGQGGAVAQKTNCNQSRVSVTS